MVVEKSMWGSAEDLGIIKWRAIRSGRGGRGAREGGAGSLQRNTIYGHENSRIVPYRCHWSSQPEAGVGAPR